MESRPLKEGGGGGGVTCNSRDVEAAIPLLHDPLLGKELGGGQLVDLIAEATACIHDECPQVSRAGHTADLEAVCQALAHVDIKPGGRNIVVIPAVR